MQRTVLPSPPNVVKPPTYQELQAMNFDLVKQIIALQEELRIARQQNNSYAASSPHTPPKTPRQSAPNTPNAQASSPAKNAAQLLLSKEDIAEIMKEAPNDAHNAIHSKRLQKIM